MTPEAQGIAIAEACDFRPDVEKAIPYRKIWRFAHPTRGVQWYTSEDLPDYLNDLNAMHEAEKTLDYHGCLRFASELRKVCSHAGIESWDFGVYHATAAQRAEAFLRTIGKWTT